MHDEQSTAPRGGQAPDGGMLAYLMAGVGGSLLALCALLPWVTVSVFGAQVSVNGLGHLDGLGGLLANVAVSESAPIEGRLVMLAGAATVLAACGGVMLHCSPSVRAARRKLALVFATLGALAALDIVVELLTLGGQSDGETNGLLSSAAQLVGPATSVSAGPGLYAGALGVLLTVAAGLLALVRQPDDGQPLHR
jgi:hypothetical protein